MSLVSTGKVSPQGCELEPSKASRAPRFVVTSVATASGFKGVSLYICAVRLINTS